MKKLALLLLDSSGQAAAMATLLSRAGARMQLVQGGRLVWDD
jgi:hypothetical protein